MSFQVRINGDTFGIHVFSRVNGKTKRQEDRKEYLTLSGQKKKKKKVRQTSNHRLSEITEVQIYNLSFFKWNEGS